MKLLLHTCCAPCSIYPLDALRDEGHTVYGYFNNPNIHPYSEYRRREEALAFYAQTQNWKVIFASDYPLDDYFRNVVYREGERCRFCYLLRQREAARMARKGKFDAFSTTLLVSPYQKHELIREVGEAAAREYDVPFLYRDFREGYGEATRRSRELEMYRQQYCGCVFSEKERFYRRAIKEGTPSGVVHRLGQNHPDSRGRISGAWRNNALGG
ncbi:MAG: epoxyqueuosine reductase QueH [Firmicutes bacterium]|nr:epoxyqueuosine reductase QueH [Bacillota bacterium]MBV1727070.1 epoxyqueuosine reductase QueH [Desulforudis sp.]MBU4533124.1 epoxyqueuosine reductase QueH [Bacillota bacterium]MBU4554759.1 epoxyqueuosine reductase QueH [Bacillota bacterium]MBV1735218.1 epoxyqueuosine reductase QueH [Desulforudis sp.]